MAKSTKKVRQSIMSQSESNREIKAKLLTKRKDGNRYGKKMLKILEQLKESDVNE